MLIDCENLPRNGLFFGNATVALRAIVSAKTVAFNVFEEHSAVAVRTTSVDTVGDENDFNRFFHDICVGRFWRDLDK